MSFVTEIAGLSSLVIMKRVLIPALLALLAPTRAYADAPQVTFQLGVGSPRTESGRSLMGASPAHIALTYKLGRISGVPQVTTAAYLESVTRSRNESTLFRGDTTESRGYSGGGVLARTSLGRSLYVGLGLGVYSIAITRTFTLGDSSDSTVTSRETLGGRAFVGVPLGRRFFLEAGYTAMGQVTLSGKPVDTSSTTFALGYRF